MLVYDSRKIIPAPLVTLTKTYASTPDGSKIGASYDITLNGTLLPFRGSPSGQYASLDTAFWQLGGYPPDEPFRDNNEDFHSIQRKQEALRWLFSRDGKSLEWQAAGGQPVVKCNPRVLDITFSQGTWADRAEYEIKLQADWLYINGTTSFEDTFASGLISTAQEQWEFNELDGRNGQAFEVAHSVSANGVLGYDENGVPFGGKEAWQHAKDWVDARATGSVDATVILAAIGANNWIGGSYTKSPTIGKTEGSYAVAEKWLIQPADTFTEKSFVVDYDQQTDEYRVRYEGTIYGLANGQRSGSASAMNAAQLAVPSSADARTAVLAQITPLIDGKTLADSPDVKNIGLSQRDGTATFSFEWSTSDDAAATIHYIAAINFSTDTSIYTMTLNAELTGRGATREIRLTNVLAAILSDAAARSKALAILGDMVPAGVTLSAAKKAKSSSINERQATANVSWTWDSSSDNSLDITINTTYPADVTAIIPIPGPAAGPIIQDMQTKTEKIVAVSIRSQANASRPDKDVMRALADANAGVTTGGYTIAGDSENWTPTKKTYQRDIRYLIKEGF